MPALDADIHRAAARWIAGSSPAMTVWEGHDFVQMHEAPYEVLGQFRGFTMKITIDIDCTPAEARTFLGLPDVAPLQAEVMKELQERMMKTLTGMDAEMLMKTWLSSGAQTVEQMQRAFWEQFAGHGPKGTAS